MNSNWKQSQTHVFKTCNVHIQAIYIFIDLIILQFSLPLLYIWHENFFIFQVNIPIKTSEYIFCILIFKFTIETVFIYLLFFFSPLE